MVVSSDTTFLRSSFTLKEHIVKYATPERCISLCHTHFGVKGQIPTQLSNQMADDIHYIYSLELENNVNVKQNQRFAAFCEQKVNLD